MSDSVDEEIENLLGQDSKADLTGGVLRQEHRKWLTAIEQAGQLPRFAPRLKNGQPAQQEETWAEIQAAYHLIKLGYKIVAWQRTTNTRDVEFEIDTGKDDIDCEVKAPGWEAEVMEGLEPRQRPSATQLARKAEGKYGKGPVLVSSYNSCNVLRSVLQNNAYKKFLPERKNLLVICDDSLVSCLDDPMQMAIALYSTSSQYKPVLPATKEVIIGGDPLTPDEPEPPERQEKPKENQEPVKTQEERGAFTDGRYQNLGGVLCLKFSVNAKGPTYEARFFPNPYAMPEQQFALPGCRSTLPLCPFFDTRACLNERHCLPFDSTYETLQKSNEVMRRLFQCSHYRKERLKSRYPLATVKSFDEVNSSNLSK